MNKMSSLYNALTSMSFYRVLMLENKANIISTSKLNERWFEGFGYIVKNAD